MLAKEDYVPSHPDLFEVKFRSGDYCSVLIARKVRIPIFWQCPGRDSNYSILLSQDFEAGDVVTYLNDFTVKPKSYATLQCGPGPDDNVMSSGDLKYGVQVLWIALINDRSVLTRPCLRRFALSQLITRAIRTSPSILVVRIVRNGAWSPSSELRSEILVSTCTANA